MVTDKKVLWIYNTNNQFWSLAPTSAGVILNKQFSDLYDR